MNGDRFARLTGETDLSGNVLEPGCAVRAFDFYSYDPENDAVSGIETEGERVSYVEGELVKINEPLGRYTIRMNTEVCHKAASITRRPINGVCYPPLNGTLTTMGWPTFGVFRIK